MNRARAGLTLIEVLVSSAILSILALAIMSATIPLSDASTASAIALDMDQTAARVLAQVRREVRQSGFDGVTDHVVEPAAGGVSSTLRFTIRTGVTSWSADELRYALVPDERQATYVGVPGAIPRNKIEKTSAGLTTDIARDVESLSFERVANSPTVKVRLVLLRPEPKWRDGTPPPPIRRTYEDEVELMNRGGGP